MAIFKKKEGGTKVGNTLRAIGSIFKAPANYSAPKVQINKPSVPKVSAPSVSGLSSGVKSAVSNIKSGVSSISAPKAVSSVGGMSIAKPVTKTGTASTRINTGITSGPNQNMSPAIKEPNMSPAFIGPRYSPYGGMSTGGKGGSLTIKSGTTKPKTGTPTYTRTTGTSPNNPITADVMSKTAALGDIYSGADYGDIGNLYKSYMSGGDIVDTSSIRSRAIADVQDRINALNQVYDQQLSRVQQEGVGRTGETTAALAARGLAGSMRGGAIADLTRTQNRQLEAQVDAERNSAIQGILADANKAAMQEIQSKTEARLGGASALISFLKGSDERKQNYINSVAQNLIATGVDLESMTPEQVQQLTQAAQKAGVSMNNIIAAYNVAKSSQGTEDGFSLSSGEARYDSRGNLIAQNAGTSSGYASTGIISPAAQALADQMTIGKAQWSNIPAALKGEVAIALNQSTGGKLSPVLSNISESKKLVDELLANTKGLKGATGTLRLGAAFGGSNASDFRAKIDRINSLLFLNAVPQMKGMGALTEREGAKLESSASTLNNYKQKESTYLNELKRLSQKLGESYQALGGDSVMQSSQSVSGTSSGGGTFAEAW